MSPAAGAAAALDAYAASAGRQPSWQVTTTPNFRILHLDAQVARQTARVAERERTVLWQIWTNSDEPPRWKTRCDIYLYPSHGEMLAMTGGKGKAGSARVRPSKLYRGQILSRRLDLTADDRHLLDSTLPHEVSHLVFGDILAGSVPLWVNEGAATLAEGPAKQRYYKRVLRRFVAGRQLYTVRDLLTMERYPPFPYQALFYAQSSSLVSFLLSLDEGTELIRFVRQATRGGYDAALRRVYRMASLEQLDRAWLTSIGAR